MKKNINVFIYTIALLLLGSNFYAHAMKIKEKKVILDKKTEQNIGGRLLDAARKGDLATVQSMLNYGINVDYYTAPYYITALYYAVDYGHSALVKKLIQAEANIHHRIENNNNTPLLCACYHNNLDIVKDLIHAGADVYYANDLGITPLKWASRSDHQECCEILVEAMLDQAASEICPMIWCLNHVPGDMFIDIKQLIADRQEMIVLQEIDKIERAEIREHLTEKYFPIKYMQAKYIPYRTLFSK